MEQATGFAQPHRVQEQRNFFRSRRRSGSRSAEIRRKPRNSGAAKKRPNHQVRFIARRRNLRAGKVSVGRHLGVEGAAGLPALVVHRVALRQHHPSLANRVRQNIRLVDAACPDVPRKSEPHRTFRGPPNPACLPAGRSHPVRNRASRDRPLRREHHQLQSHPGRKNNENKGIHRLAEAIFVSKCVVRSQVLLVSQRIDLDLQRPL